MYIGNTSLTGPATTKVVQAVNYVTPLSESDQNTDNGCIFWIPTFCIFRSIWSYSQWGPFSLERLCAPFLKLFLAFSFPVSFFYPLDIGIITGQKYLF